MQRSGARDSEASRRAILDAAEQLFAEKGFSGTSMRDIAGASGKSQSLIHHHFGFKKDLWDAVRQRFGVMFAETLLPMLRSGEVDSRFIRSWTKRYLRFWSENPNLRRIMLWRQLEEDQEPWEAINDIYRESVDKIRESQKKGLVRRDLRPGHLISILTGAHLFWLQNKPEYCRWDGLDLEDPAIDTSYLRDFIRIIFGGVLAK
jgi:TetR/AcrR family transcriptional regulator